MIKILINGASGRMGRSVSLALKVMSDFQVVGEIDREDDLLSAIQTLNPDVVIDFTTAAAVWHNANIIIEARVHPVIGTSGLLPDQVAQLQQKASDYQLGGIVAPNFSVGAVLMMRFAKEAASYFEHAEIIECHHDNKQDSPSATAMKTAEMIKGANPVYRPRPSERENIASARGAVHQDIHIHSVRMSGFLAHQEVIFGGQSETLTLRHDSINRECFIPGIVLACRKVMTLKTIVYGLENIIESEPRL